MRGRPRTVGTTAPICSLSSALILALFFYTLLSQSIGPPRRRSGLGPGTACVVWVLCSRPNRWGSVRGPVGPAAFRPPISGFVRPSPALDQPLSLLRKTTERLVLEKAGCGSGRLRLDLDVAPERVRHRAGLLGGSERLLQDGLVRTRHVGGDLEHHPGDLPSLEGRRRGHVQLRRGVPPGAELVGERHAEAGGVGGGG